MPLKSNKKAKQDGQSHFGLRIAKARREAKLTQTDLANKASVHISHIQRIEAGTSQPTIDVAKRIAEALAVSLDLLVLDRPIQAIESQLSDKELIDLFIALESFSDQDIQAIKTILHAMSVKHRVEAALRNPVR